MVLSSVWYLCKYVVIVRVSVKVWISLWVWMFGIIWMCGVCVNMWYLWICEWMSSVKVSVIWVKFECENISVWMCWLVLVCEWMWMWGDVRVWSQGGHQFGYLGQYMMGLWGWLARFSMKSWSVTWQRHEDVCLCVLVWSIWVSWVCGFSGCSLNGSAHIPVLWTLLPALHSGPTGLSGQSSPSLP